MQFRLRPTLLTATAVLIVTTMAVTGLLLHHYIGQMIERLLSRQFDIVAGGTAVQVETLFDSAVSVLETQQARTALDMLPLDEPDRLGREFAERLRREPHLAWISYGDLARNRFVGATRRPDGAILVNIAAADVGNSIPIERIALPDGSWRPADLPQKEPYAVRDQPWFKAALAADGVLVSDPYEFAEGRPGVSLTLRHTDPAGRPQGAFTVDFFLEDLSHGLARLTERDRNDAVLLGPGGLVLASAGAERPPDLSELAREVYAEHHPALETLAAGQGLLVDADWQGAPYRVALHRIVAGSSGPVALAIFEPLDLLFAPVRDLRSDIVTITLAAIALGLLGAVLLATSVSRPLRALVASADRIRRFDLDRPVGVSSWISEVSSLAREMEGMRVGVRSFGRYVPIALVRRLLEAGGAPVLGGERRELTMLFSDIAGFTSQSESLPPEQLMQRISAYFQVMTEALEAHHGVVDKFIGDAIMALWNAPAADTRHAHHACEAVLACRAANERLNAALAAEGMPPLPTRFGVHTGEVVVGNLGSDERMQYTALGADVNLAARIEGLNKHYRTAILVSDATRARAGDGFLFRFAGRAQPVGTTRPVTLYELLGAASDPAAGALALRCACWADAVARLDAGEPGEARRHFEAIAARSPDDGLAAYWCQKLAALLARPPEPAWDGIDRFEQK
jgi:adenylate cyclase